MRKKAARSAAVVLAAAMTVGILAGCGSKGQGNEETSNRTEDGTGFKDYSEGFPEEVKKLRFRFRYMTGHMKVGILRIIIIQIGCRQNLVINTTSM